MEKEREGKQSRRVFLWQVGAGLVGLTGLSRLAKAMTFPQPLAIPRCPDPNIPVVCDSTGQPYTCDQAQLYYHCYNSFTCVNDFTCGGSANGDFQCENEPFTCQTHFRCMGAEPGVDYTCDSGSFTCGGQVFECQITDFACSPNFTCTPQFDCTGIQYTCPSGFTCNPNFDCQTGWSGDYDCLANFVCVTDFDCVGSEPGVQFECRDGFNCTGGGQPFYCDPGDFGCTNQNLYQCNNGPGANYTIPIAVPINPPET